MRKIVTLIALLLFVCRLTPVAQPVLYGLTSKGGLGGGGALIKIDPATNQLTTSSSWDLVGRNPNRNTLVEFNGKLYGMTTEGGSNGVGSIFSFDPATNAHIKLFDFNGTNGMQPYGGLIVIGSKLYGMTSGGGSSFNGTIFSFDPASNTYAKLFDFSNSTGRNPYGSLVVSGSKLYGMTTLGGSTNRGTIFSFDLASNIHTKLFDFNGTNGRIPYGNLVVSGSKLYGMTFQGGSSDNGSIFSFDPVSNTHTKLFDFNGTSGVNPYGSLVVSGDRLFGMTNTGGSNNLGTIFAFDIVTNTHAKLFDFSNSTGRNPYGSLVVYGSKLYGMTSVASGSNYGTIFSFDPATGTHARLFNFTISNGRNPYGSLVVSGSKLFGMTFGGGSSDFGTIFSFDPANNSHAKLFDFNSSNGNYPYGSLVVSGGKLYGMTITGGNSNYGTIFSFDPTSNTQAKLFDFDGTNGRSPYGSLVVSDGKLYGMTTYGGSGDNGTIFSFDPVSNTHTKLFDFNFFSGINPYGSLVVLSGKLYGMTNFAGSNGVGTIFNFDPASNTHAKLFDFNNTNGGYPYGSLVVSGGKLFGVTNGGGSGTGGTIFSFDPATNTHAKLHDFVVTNGVATNGAAPRGNLVEFGGKLYGMTYGGGSGTTGTIFSFDPTINLHAKLFDFNFTNGASPQGSLIVSGGKLYGMTTQGGSSFVGTIFSFDPVTNTHTKLQDFNGTNGAEPYYGAFVEYNPCTPTTEVCDGVDNDCDGQIDEGVKTTFYQDSDGDGFGNPAVTIEACAAPAGYVANNADCDDANAAKYTNAPEICDGIDNDCDGQIDEGVLNTYYLDTDGDGFGDPAQSIQACSAPAGYVTATGDCSDNNNALNPGATEICDGIDNDCDGQIDEGLTLVTWYQDSDGDGYGNAAVSVQNCGQPSGYVGNNTDCNDNNNTIYPGATEVCDGVDNNCDGTIDEGVKNTYYPDADGDGYGAVTGSIQACAAPAGYVSSNVDCDDTKASVYPGAPELCDGIDNDCDGVIDDGLTFVTYYRDLDGDGYGDASQSQSSCSVLAGWVTQAGDCNDNNNAIYPGAPEVCNGIDDDCDGTIDEGVKNTYYPDADGDGYGAVTGSIQACAAPAGYVSSNVDCDDTKASVYPGAPELCDGIDNDCDGVIDDGVLNTYYLDADGDGFGKPGAIIQACALPAGYSNTDTDCDDTKASVYPGAPELCDGIDNNCNGGIDEGIIYTTYYRDQDGDGYGDASQSQSSCSAITGYVTQAGDCNDNNPAVNPGAPEVCNGIDDDCDGTIDEGVKNTYYPDADGDGFGAATGAVQACGAPAGYVSSNTDCNDGDNKIYPGAPELCDGKDNDCDGQIDDGVVLVTYYRDQDGDGYGDASQSQSSCSVIAGYVSQAGDCNDNNPTINPGATEVCNGIDDDCDGTIDEGVTNTYYPDADGDGFGAASGAVQACAAPAGYVSSNTDCNDGDNKIYPGAPELCDGKDNDCDGQIDDGVAFVTYYRDQDGDGYGNASQSQSSCSAIAGYVTLAGDCNDNNAAIKPGATEVCGNNIDDDCDGQVDEGCQTVVQPKVYMSGGTVFEGNSGQRSLVFTLWLSRPSKQAVSVQYTTANRTAIAGQDYVAKSGTVNFAPNTLVQFITVSVMGDRTFEPNESLQVGLSSAINGVLGTSSALGTIVNDDRRPAIRVEDLTVTESSQRAQVKVELTNPSSETIRVKYETRNQTAFAPQDYTATSGELTFLPGETTKLVNVPVIWDALMEQTEFFRFRLKESVNATLESDDYGRREASVYIRNSAVQVVNNSSLAQERMPGMLDEPLPLQVKVLPNPSTNRFTLNFSGGSSEKIQLRVTDIQGRVVEARTLGAGIQSVQLGESWNSGAYVLEVIQGSERKTLQLVKLR